MKKTLIGLGLAGILSVLGPQVSALEVNVDGYAVPSKENTEVIEEKDMTTSENDKIFRIMFKRYIKPDGTGFNELTINGRTISYRIFTAKLGASDYAGDIANSYVIEDSDCDGIFETKAGGTEEVLKPLPDCYLK